MTRGGRRHVPPVQAEAGGVQAARRAGEGGRESWRRRASRQPQGGERPGEGAAVQARRQPKPLPPPHPHAHHGAGVSSLPPASWRAGDLDADKLASPARQRRGGVRSCLDGEEGTGAGLDVAPAVQAGGLRRGAFLPRCPGEEAEEEGGGGVGGADARQLSPCGGEGVQGGGGADAGEEGAALLRLDKREPQGGAPRRLTLDKRQPRRRRRAGACRRGRWRRRGRRRRGGGEVCSWRLLG